MASSAVETTTGSGAAGRASASKSRATAPGRGAAVTGIDGQQRVARVRQSGRGSGVEVTERDHDDDRERVQGVISRPARSQHDRGSNLHRRCRTGGVSTPRVSIYTPSHTSTYSPVPAKSLHINQIQTEHPTPRCRKWVQGGSRGAPPRKTGVLRTRQVFLRHTCCVGSLPSVTVPAGRLRGRSQPIAGSLSARPEIAGSKIAVGSQEEVFCGSGIATRRRTMDGVSVRKRLATATGRAR